MKHTPGPGPGMAVARECARTLGAGALLPLRAVGYLLRRRSLEREIRAGLLEPSEIDEAPDGVGGAAGTLERPLRIFVSCAEASGETHGLNLVRALREELAARGAPEPEIAGLGGERLAAAGVGIVGDPVSRAAMGAEVRRELGFYLRLLRDAARHFRDRRPDLCIPVDSPALHVPLGRLAHAYGIPVVHFVTPQYWGWAPWRIRSYRRAVDLALTILPFEPEWFARRNVRTAHVGHPLLDELAEVPRGQPEAGSRTLVLLPGSRGGVIDRNLPWMLTAVARLRLTCPEVEVALPHDRSEHAERIRRHVDAAGAGSWARLDRGGLHDCLAKARAAFSVSGTILLDLLHHRLPTVVVYRLGAGGAFLAERFLTVPWFSSVNLLAGREVLPEFRFHGAGPMEDVGQALERCILDEAWRAACVAGLDEAAARLGPPGATRRAARHALALLRPPEGAGGGGADNGR
ncbi:MAG: hypothetical protein O7B99_09075 [Planctomycetota bacterium]|nr:hypothetical protein [Planctomycetota bacterium]